ncbi:MAG: CRISPR-associated protein Cas4 [Saprospiraceae bacterium]|nr:CRISPR-associated protein Cas4 [Saprospiraceae bacterium]
MISLTPSHIIQYLYCPRFTYFEHVLAVPQYEEKNYKVMRGRRLHDERLEQNKGYLRKRLGVVERHDDQYLTNELLRGRVDEVLLLADGSAAPLDYKFAEYKERVYSTYQTQLYCYAWLIEDNFGRRVDRGYLVYTRSRNRLVELPVREEDKVIVKASAEKIRRILADNYFPKPTTAKRRCTHCTYRNICVK